MRCPDCNKFVSYDEQDPELDSLEVEDNRDGTATVTGNVRLVLPCSECNQELKEYTFEVEKTVDLVDSEFTEIEHRCECGHRKGQHGKKRKLEMACLETVPGEVPPGTLICKRKDCGHDYNSHQPDDECHENGCDCFGYRGPDPDQIPCGCKAYVPSKKTNEDIAALQVAQEQAAKGCASDDRTHAAPAAHDLTIDDDGCERADRSVGRGRYCETFYGYNVNYTIKCTTCGLEVTGEISDDVKASHMDELV